MKKVTALIFFFISTVTFYSAPVQAIGPCPTPPYPSGVPIGDCFGFGQFGSLGDIVSKLVPVMFSVAAVGVVIYFLLGAFKFLMSGGNKEAVAEGRNMITHSIIGFVILIFVFLILQFLLSALLGITGFQLF